MVEHIVRMENVDFSYKSYDNQPVRALKDKYRL